MPGLDTADKSCPIAQMCAPGARRFKHVIWPVRHTDTDRITRGETRATRAHTGSALEDGDDDNPQGEGSQHHAKARRTFQTQSDQGHTSNRTPTMNDCLSKVAVDEIHKGVHEMRRIGESHEIGAISTSSAKGPKVSGRPPKPARGVSTHHVTG